VALFKDFKSSKFLISYSEDGLIPLEVLENFFSQFGSVKTTLIKHKRFKSNSGGAGGVLHEYLLHIKR
jgi:adenine-specific DNA methylase